MLKLLFTKRAASSAALLFLVALTGLLLFPYIQSWNLSSSDALPSHEKLEIITSQGSNIFEIEIAKTPQEQARGLMFRKELLPNKGMLFVHAAPKEVSMWMQNTYIPLDMVFIKEDGFVHRIEEKTEPLSKEIISSKGPVSAVLEVTGGTAARLGLKVGDKIRHPFFKSP